MGTLFFQKRWFKPSKNNDSSKNKEKDCIQRGSIILIGLFLKMYLQLLFLIGAFSGRIAWVDKQIKWCYNIFDNLEISYQKYW